MLESGWFWLQFALRVWNCGCCSKLWRSLEAASAFALKQGSSFDLAYQMVEYRSTGDFDISSGEQEQEHCRGRGSGTRARIRLRPVKLTPPVLAFGEGRCSKLTTGRQYVINPSKESFPFSKNTAGFLLSYDAG